MKPLDLWEHMMGGWFGGWDWVEWLDGWMGGLGCDWLEWLGGIVRRMGGWFWEMGG